jgi:uncharacterized membrane protein YhaH (DUF805 family)
MVSLLFSFRGRINRKQYWMGTTLVGFISAIMQVMASAMRAGAMVDVKDPGAALASAASSSALALPLFVLVTWSSLAVQFKRFHDRGRTGWITMLPLVLVVLLIVSILGDIFSGTSIERVFSDALPYFGLLMLTSLAFFIDLGCLPGVEGTNKYGPPPGTPPASLDPSRPSGAVEATSSLFGAQSAMDRAIADARKPQPAPQRPAPAPQAAFAAATVRAPVQPAPAGFGRRVTR